MVPDIRDLGLRSPCEKVGGLVYFGRMLDKIRSHATGELPPDYQANLGKGFDGSCVRLLEVDYDQLVERAKQGGTDDEILRWCFSMGRQPSDDEIRVWNEFMRKRGWNDEVSETLERRKPAWLPDRRSRRCSHLSTPTKGAHQTPTIDSIPEHRVRSPDSVGASLTLACG